MKLSHYERQKRWLKKNPNYVRNWKKKNPYYHKAYLKEWSRTYIGCLSYIYSRMRRRIRTDKHYKGLSLISRQEFYEWAKREDTYYNVFKAWIDSDYDKYLSPSIDRLDSSKGYVFGNMRFITTQENRVAGCKKANKVRWQNHVRNI